jgi:hypothetical protein
MVVPAFRSRYVDAALRKTRAYAGKHDETARTDYGPEPATAMTTDDAMSHARIRLEYDIDSRAAAAQEVGRQAAERARRSLGQRFRKLQRDLDHEMYWLRRDQDV